MKHLILILLLAAFGAQAQRYSLSPVGPITTNATVAATTLTAYNSTLDVGNTTTVDLLYKFRVHGTNTTSNVVFTLRSAVDGSYASPHWRTQLVWTVAANGTNEAWGTTNISVRETYFLELTSITNGNPGKLTNIGFYIGQRNGL